MLFEETWQQEVLPASSLAAPTGTVVCFLSDPGHQHAVRRVFERLGGGRVRIVFVAQEHMLQARRRAGNARGLESGTAHLRNRFPALARRRS